MSIISSGLVKGFLILFKFIYFIMSIYLITDSIGFIYQKQADNLGEAFKYFVSSEPLELMAYSITKEEVEELIKQDQKVIFLKEGLDYIKSIY